MKAAYSKQRTHHLPPTADPPLAGSPLAGHPQGDHVGAISKDRADDGAPGRREPVGSRTAQRSNFRPDALSVMEAQ